MITLKIEDGALIEVPTQDGEPVYHGGWGKTYLAVIEVYGGSRYQYKKRFCPHARGPGFYYEVGTVERGHALEFAADRYRGKRTPRWGRTGTVKVRWFGTVVERSDAELVIQPHPSADDAILHARRIRNDDQADSSKG